MLLITLFSRIGVEYVPKFEAYLLLVNSLVSSFSPITHMNGPFSRAQTCNMPYLCRRMVIQQPSKHSELSSQVSPEIIKLNAICMSNIRTASVG